MDAGSSTGNTDDEQKYTSPPADTISERDLDDPRLGALDDIDETEEDEDDEDDMDFMPAFERRGDGDEEDEYESASEGLSGIDIEFEVMTEESEVMGGEDEEEDEDEDEDGEGEETETETGLGAILNRAGGGRPVFVTREQIARMLGTNGLRRLLARGGGGIASFLSGEDEEEEDEDDDFGFDRRMRGMRSSRRPRVPVEFEKVPSEEGRKLMLSGTFGGNERGEDSFKRKRKLASRLLRREMGLGSYGRQKARDGLLRHVSFGVGIS
jgi:WD repeat-containing protein 23